MKRQQRKQANTHGSAYKTWLPSVMAVCSVSVMGFVLAMPTAQAIAPSLLTYIAREAKAFLVNDSYKIFALQQSVDGRILSETAIATAQKKATVEKQIILKNEMLDLYKDFMGPGAITSSSRCVALNTRMNDTNAAIKATLLNHADRLAASNLGAYGSDFDRTRALADFKSQHTCTLEQSNLGYCTPTLSGGAYYDVDFGLALASERLSNSQFTANKLGVLTIADSIKDGATIRSCEGELTCMKKIQKEDTRSSVNSLVANSLLTASYNRTPVGIVK